MKKSIVFAAVLVMVLFLLAGCKCEDGQHNYVSVVKKEATCSNEGVRLFVCEICRDKYTEPIETVPHNYVESVKDATCTEEGVRTFTCSECGDTYTEPIDMIEHNYVESVKEATCTEEGVRTFTCSECGDTYTEPIERLDHDYSESVREATCTGTGERTFVCKNCGDKQSEVIPSLGHAWAAATCTAPKTCTRCKLTEGEKLPHTYSAGKCTACGASAPTYALNTGINQGNVRVKVVMQAINRGRIEVQNLTNNYYYMTIPAGTYYIADSTSNQNMLVTYSTSFELQPGASASVNTPTACMNIKRSIPNSSAGYTVGFTSNTVLQNLVKLFEENNSPYGVRQAAVWIVTDNATYEDTNTLVSNGTRAISQSNYNEAQRLVALARGY